jgi:hypothetical protein
MNKDFCSDRPGLAHEMALAVDSEPVILDGNFR